MKIFNLYDTHYNLFTSKVRTYLSTALSKAKIGFGNSTVFGQIINVLAAAIQNIMLYIEDSLVEQNKYTAQRKKSIYSLAALSGYKPFLGSAATAQVRINFVPNNYKGLNIIINNHEPLTCTQNGLSYCLMLPQEAVIMSLDKDVKTKQFAIVQGTYNTQTFTSTGGKYYTFNMKYNGNIDMNYTEVYVNNERYEIRESLYDMTADSKECTWRPSYSSGIDLIFGNDKHGRALKDGDVIKIVYLTHDGEGGNIDADVKTYFVFDKMLNDISGEQIDGNAVFLVTFATIDSISSGSDSETTDSVRHMIGLNSRSLCLASPENYKMWINRFSFCGYNRTWSDPGSLVVRSLIIKNYKLQLREGKDYFNLREEDFILTDMQKESIKKCINNTGNQLAGVTYDIVDPELCKYACYMYVKLKSAKYDRESIKTNIRRIVGEFFSDVENDIFIPKSDLIVLIKNQIPEIDSVDLYFLSERNETALQKQEYVNKSYIYNPATGTYKTTTETVHLYAHENPNLGLDEHGNILLNGYGQFPVLMGGWDFLNKNNEEVAILNGEPLIITIA